MLGSLLASAIAHKATERLCDNAARKAVTAAAVVAATVAVASAAEKASEKAEAVPEEFFPASGGPRAVTGQKMKTYNPSGTAQTVRGSSLTTEDFYTKFAMCCYVAKADGNICDDERHNLDIIANGIIRQCSNRRVTNEIRKIGAADPFTFAFLESYLQKSSPEVIESFLELAEDMAEADLKVTEAEEECIYKIRRYLTDRTGEDHSRRLLKTKKEISLKCPGCGAMMDIKTYNNSLVCPFCGNTRYVAVE